MRRRAALEDVLVSEKLFAILRAVPDVHLLHLVEAIVDGGIRAIEVTYSDPCASRQIRRLRETVPDNVLIGAGTVTSASVAEEALEQGAAFLVTPHLQLDVIEVANRCGAALVCGALTPTEIAEARRNGARLIKIFPASVMGASYFRALLGPYPDLELFAVGGLSEKNLLQYLESGAVGAAIGGALTNVAWQDPDFDGVRSMARKLTSLVAMHYRRNPAG